MCVRIQGAGLLALALAVASIALTLTNDDFGRLSLRVMEHTYIPTIVGAAFSAGAGSAVTWWLGRIFARRKAR